MSGSITTISEWETGATYKFTLSEPLNYTPTEYNITLVEDYRLAGGYCHLWFIKCNPDLILT